MICFNRPLSALSVGDTIAIPNIDLSRPTHMNVRITEVKVGINVDVITYEGCSEYSQIALYKDKNDVYSYIRFRNAYYNVVEC